MRAALERLDAATSLGAVAARNDEQPLAAPAVAGWIEAAGGVAWS